MIFASLSISFCLYERKWIIKIEIGRSFVFNAMFWKYLFKWSSPISGSRSPVRSPPASFYPPLHSMWGFSAHGAPSTPSGVTLNGGNHTPTSIKDPVTGFGYPPTPPIDLKSGTTDNQQQHLQIQPQSHHDYLQQPPELPPSGDSGGGSAVSAGVLPSLTSIETKHSTQ